MWQQAYLGMCNRAVVLNHVILKAEQVEATVKPVSILHTDIKRFVKPIKSSSVDKHFVGLGRKFYHVAGIGDDESSQEELDISSPRPHKRCPRKNNFLPRLPNGLGTVVSEIPKTEEVDLSCPEESRLVVRLHLRSRSVLVHEKRTAFLTSDDSVEKLHHFEYAKRHSMSHQSSLATSVAVAQDSSPDYSWLPSKSLSCLPNKGQISNSRLELKSSTSKITGTLLKNFLKMFVSPLQIAARMVSQQCCSLGG